MLEYNIEVEQYLLTVKTFFAIKNICLKIETHHEALRQFV